MNQKKRIIYIIAAVLLIAAGLYMGRGQEENTVNNTEMSWENQKAAVEASESQGIAVEAGEAQDYVAYYFRNEDLLEQHYEKHGMEMGFASMEAYEEAACAVIYHPDVLTKTEEEDGDYVYYIEESNEFVVVSTDGYIRTYFQPSAGIEYFNRQ